MKRIDINIKNPDECDASLAAGNVATAWLVLQRAMIIGGGGYRAATALLLDQIDMQIHVDRRLTGLPCSSECWVCKIANEVPESQ